MLRFTFDCFARVTKNESGIDVTGRGWEHFAIEALGGTIPKRRGRPPKNALASIPIAASNLAPPMAKKPGRRMFTAAQRKAQAAKMKAYWAKRRKRAGG